ncbi:hypothetical protein BCR36DRAFT_395791 [Piromyces finnis]|uniref:BHLH domain-containing protein n=1 Tax=Piromyces finnis TaxID=1754191 RepID=A0A1Y1VIA6_9FUNG|nr:hypothetical protein BCR36DRAFT_395791 [Piromyces finnis]|eukprot:ORX56063.1 hypothetical protein BCR36DRAFT_395791 [Piromyces finnis]
MNSKNITNLHNLHSFINTHKQSFLSSITDSNSINKTNTTNILLNSNKEIFTSPIISFPNVNRNNAISTPTHSLINEANSNITIPPSDIDNIQSVFRLPEPYVSKDILTNSDFQESNTNNVRKKYILDSNVTKIPSTLVSQLKTNIKKDNIIFDNLSINENNEIIKKDEFNPLTSPVIVPEYNKNESYSISKVSQKVSNLHTLPSSSINSSPTFISSISKNHNLPGSIMPITTISSHTSYVNENKNSHNILDKVNTLSHSKPNKSNNISLASPFILSNNNNSSNSNKEHANNSFSPLVGPMLTDSICFESSPTTKSISQSILPITPSVLMHLDNHRTSSLIHNPNINSTNNSKTIKQAQPTNVDLIDININNMKRMLNESSFNFALSEMNVNSNINSINNINSSLNSSNLKSNKKNDAVTTPIFMNYIIENNNASKMNVQSHHNIEDKAIDSQNKIIENNSLLTPLILDGSEIDFDKQVYSSLNNNTLLLGSNQSNDISITATDATRESNKINNLNTPISVSTIFNNYNSRHGPETEVIKPIKTSDKNQITEAIDKLISSNKKFHENSNINQKISTSNDKLLNVPNIIIENANDISNYLKVNTISLNSSQSPISSSIISPKGPTNRKLPSEIIENVSHQISPSIFPSDPLSSDSINSNSNKKEKLNKKDSIGQDNNSSSKKLIENTISITTGNSNTKSLPNIDKMTTEIKDFISPSTNNLTINLSSLLQSDSMEVEASFESLPPPTIASNINVNQDNDNIPNFSIIATPKSENNLFGPSNPPSIIPSTTSSTVITSVNKGPNKLKPVKASKINKTISNSRITPLLPNKITSMDDALKLASKSNYQNVLRGETTSLGLNPNLISGIEVRKMNHKNAEQKRRDSLKQGFENLKVVIPSIFDKNPSKIMIITRSYEYICMLQEEMRVMKLKEKLYLEKLKSEGVNLDDFMKELEKEISREMKEEKKSLPKTKNIINSNVKNLNNTSKNTNFSNSNSNSQPTEDNKNNKIEAATKVTSSKRKLTLKTKYNKNSTSIEPESKKSKIIDTNKTKTKTNNIDIMPVTYA